MNSETTLQYIYSQTLNQSFVFKHRRILKPNENHKLT